MDGVNRNLANSREWFCDCLLRLVLMEGVDRGGLEPRTIAHHGGNGGQFDRKSLGAFDHAIRSQLRNSKRIARS